MILKGSQRAGSAQLAAHLLRLDENDHVTVHEVRGFVSDDLPGALAEAHAISKGTKCKQFMFSLSLNPPKDAVCSVDQMVEAADRAEESLGLTGQPRVIVIHEKEGRRHIHAVWSRIDPTDMRAVQMAFFKNRLAALSKDLYLENGWELPRGHRENGWKSPLNFTLAEWQQAKRLGMHAKELKQLFADAWRYSDNGQSFRAALEERGYFLAQGTRRAFVAIDVNGETFSLTRMTGAKTRDIEARLGNPSALPSIEDVTREIDTRFAGAARSHLHDLRAEQQQELRPLLDERARMLMAQRKERDRLDKLLEERRRIEQRDRQARFRRGVRGLLDIVIGRAAAIRRENERQAFEAHQRDSRQREALYEQQSAERAALILEIAMTRRRHRMTLSSLVEHVVTLTGRGPRRTSRDRFLSLSL